MATAITTLKNFIDGEFVDPADGQTEPILNPSTGEAIAEAPLSTAADVDRAVSAAKAAFGGWAATTPGERALALLKLADAIEEHADELAERVAGFLARRPDHVEIVTGGREPDRPGAGRGKHRRAQAGGDHAAHHAEAGRVVG